MLKGEVKTFIVDLSLSKLLFFYLLHLGESPECQSYCPVSVFHHPNAASKKELKHVFILAIGLATPFSVDKY